tara:strand:+ start:109 stop:300 length:192 start_codon:yes stop_codon:yes gene_type:complete
LVDPEVQVVVQVVVFLELQVVQETHLLQLRHKVSMVDQAAVDQVLLVVEAVLQKLEKMLLVPL